MKTIEQLLELKNNQYYVFTPEEQSLLDDFLSSQSARKKSQKASFGNSEKNIPATVINKNIVAKETGEIASMEDYIHPDAVK